MSVRQVFRVAIVALAFVVAGQESRAAFIVGSTAFDFVGETTVPTGGNLNTASGLTFGGGTGVNGIQVNASRTGDFFSQLTFGAFGDVTSLNFNVAGAPVGSTLTLPFNITFAAGKTFTSSSGVVVVRTTAPPGAAGRLSADILGTVNFTGFAPTAASLSVSFVQNGGPGNAIGGTGTLSTIAPVPVPATFVLASLGGVMMAGARGLRRRLA